MALKIRLARGGSKKRPYYRIVVADARMPRDGRFIEKIGNYNPLLKKDDENRVVIDLERAKHWLEKGAQPTDRVARFLGAADLVKWDLCSKAAPRRSNCAKRSPSSPNKWPNSVVTEKVPVRSWSSQRLNTKRPSRAA